MRSLEPRGGNSTKSFVGQPPLPEFSWVGGLLLEGSAQGMAAHPSRKMAAAEREGCNSPLRLNRERALELFPHSGHRNTIGPHANAVAVVFLKVPHGSADPTDQSIEAQIVNLYSFRQSTGLLHDAIPTPPSKSSRVGSSGEPHSSVYQELQECIYVGRSGSDVVGIGGGDGGSGIRLGRVMTHTGRVLM